MEEEVLGVDAGGVLYGDEALGLGDSLGLVGMLAGGAMLVGGAMVAGGGVLGGGTYAGAVGVARGAVAAGKDDEEDAAEDVADEAGADVRTGAAPASRWTD